MYLPRCEFRTRHRGVAGEYRNAQKFKGELVESDIVELNFDSDIEEELRDAIDKIWREAGHWSAFRVEDE